MFEMRRNRIGNRMIPPRLLHLAQFELFQPLNTDTNDELFIASELLSRSPQLDYFGDQAQLSLNLSVSV